MSGATVIRFPGSRELKDASLQPGLVPEVPSPLPPHGILRGSLDTKFFLKAFGTTTCKDILQRAASGIGTIHGRFAFVAGDDSPYAEYPSRQLQWAFEIRQLSFERESFEIQLDNDLDTPTVFQFTFRMTGQKKAQAYVRAGSDPTERQKPFAAIWFAGYGWSNYWRFETPEARTAWKAWREDPHGIHSDNARERSPYPGVGYLQLSVIVDHRSATIAPPDPVRRLQGLMCPESEWAQAFTPTGSPSVTTAAQR